MKFSNEELEVSKVKITIECEPGELKKVLPAISGSEEYKKIINKREFVYFYYDNGNRVPMVTGERIDLHNILMIDEQLQGKLKHDFPKAFPGNLFVFIDGCEFKINLNQGF